MQIIIPEINPGQQGKEVANLQEALIFLLKKENIKLTASEYEPAIKKLEEEQNKQEYGEATQQVVTQFQTQYNLANKEGWVDKETASKLNEVLKQLGAFDDTENDTVFIVKGFIRNANGEGYANAIVRAFVH
jgi:peptidoglycan hydrolase-like protein with peptidoglycan-binding domain